MKTKFKILFLALFLVYSFALLSCDIQGIIDGFGTQVEKQEFTVRFMVDGRVYHTLDVSSGDKIELPKNPTKEGYEFVGWYLQDGKEFTKDIIITSNVIIVAKFEKDALKYTVTYYVDDNYYSSITVVENSKVQHPSAPYKNGYQFVGWMYNGELFNVNTLINSNIRLDACFEKVASQYYYVTYMVDDTVFGVDTYLQGEIVYAPSNPTKEGYEFVGWYLDPYYKDEVSFGTEIYSNMTVFAKFEEVKAPSNWSQNNNGYEIIEDFDEVKFVSTIDKGPWDSVYKSHQLSDSNDLCIEFSATNDTWIIFQLELFGEVYEYRAIGTGSKDSMVIGVPEHFKNQMVNFRIFIGASSYGDGYELILHGIKDNQPIVNEVISVSDALMYEDGAAVVVKGLVKKIRTDWSNTYGNMSVIITDGVNDLLVFRLKTMVNVGDEVIVTGEMGTYKDQREIADGATAEIISSNNPTQFVGYSLDIVENNLLSYEYLPDEYDLYVWAWSSTGIIGGEFYPVNYNWTFAVKEGCDRVIFVLMPTGYSPDWGYMYDQTSALVILDGTIQENNDTYLVSYYVDGEFYYSYDVNLGDIAPEIEAPFKEGYYFESWNYLGYSWDFNNPVFENMELHATYSPLLEISGTETIQYTGEETTNMADGDYAETLGITSGLFKITANQCSPKQNIGLNRNGQIRLYSMYSDGNELVITGKVMIKKIIISFGDRGGEFTVNGMFGSVNVSEYEINSSRVVIKNVDPSNVQLRIVSITIEYGVIEDTPTDIDGFTFNEYEDYIEITGYNGKDELVEIPSEINSKPVTLIADKAFVNCQFKELVIPESIISIGQEILVGCNQLESLTTPFIGHGYNEDQDGIRLFFGYNTDAIPASLKKVVDIRDTHLTCQAFAGTPVEEIHFLADIEYIGIAYLFNESTSVKRVFLPRNIGAIWGDYVEETDVEFYYHGSKDDWNNISTDDISGLNVIYYSDSEPIEEGNYWYYDEFGNVEIWPEFIPFSYIEYDDSITIAQYIGTNVNVIIPEYINGKPVTTINDGAFGYLSNVPIESLFIPSTVNSLSPLVIGQASNLVEVVVDPNNPTYDSRNNCNAIIETATNKLVAGCVGTLIPDGVVTIGYSAFENCVGIDYLIFPKSVISIEGFALWGCSISCVYYEGSAEDWSKIDAVFDGNHLIAGYTNVYYYSETKPYEASLAWYYEDGIPTKWFEEYDGFIYEELDDSITILKYVGSSLEVYVPSDINGKSVTAIQYEAFKGLNINNLVIPNSIKRLDNYSLSFITFVDVITLSDGIEYIGRNTFYGSIINELHIPNSIEAGEGEEFAGMTVQDLYVGSGFTNYGGYLFGGSDITNLRIKGTVDFISNDAFIYGSVENVYVNDINVWLNIEFEGLNANPLYLGANLYVGIELYTYLVSDSSITKINDYAFAGYDLFGFAISDTVYTIGDYAFYDNNNLTDIWLNGVGEIGDYAFAECNGLINIYQTSALQYVFKYAFENCSMLESIENAANLICIDDGAFSGCDKLSSLVLGVGFTYVGAAAIPYLKDIFYEGTKADVGYINVACDNFFDIIHFYNETEPTEEGSYWHYVDGEPSIWYSHMYDYEISEEGIVINGYKWIDTSLVIPSKIDGVAVVGISSFAFEGSSIISIIIPASITNIGEYAFKNCKNLSYVEIKKDGPDGYSLLSTGQAIFYGCDSLSTLIMPYGGKDCMPGGPAEGFVDEVNLGYHFGSFTVDDNKTYIPSSLQTVIITDNYQSFYHCLYNLEINTVGILGYPSIYESFFNGSKFKKLVISQEVTSIYNFTFENCSIERVLYEGTEEEFIQNVYVEGGENNPIMDVLYFYSEDAPSGGRCWHYVDGVATIWT